MAIYATILLAASAVGAGPDGEKAFRSFMDMALGGTWTTTSMDGTQATSTYRKLGDGKFVLITTKGILTAYTGVIGVDPANGACTWWVFNDDGAVGKDTLTQEGDNSWVLEGKSTGPRGTIRYKGRITRLGPDTVKEDVLVFVVYGKEYKPGTFTWKRTGQKDP